MRRQKVLIVYPPNQLMAIETPRPDGSLGPLYLAAALERAGYETDVLDCSVGGPGDTLEETFYRSVMQENGLTRIGMSYEKIRDFIAAGKYDVIGINSNFTPQTRMALEVARAAKEARRDITVVAGGVNARNLPDRFLKSGVVDYVVLTEGENILPALVRCLSQGQAPSSAVPGIMFLSGGRICTRPLGTGVTYDDLDLLPFPAWEKLPFEKYDRIASPHGVIASPDQRYAPLMTSRGCPFKCAFCHISLEKEHAADSGGIGNYRMKSVSRVLEEILVLKGLGVKKLYFEDDSLLAKKARVKEIFEWLLGHGLKIADVNGVNLVHFLKGGKGGRPEIDRDYLELLKAGGFDQIVFPVESASQRILDTYATAKLDHANLDVIELVRLAREVGILCPINMMIGFPDETEQEMRSSIELGKRLVDAGAPYCTFFIPIPFPGSALYEIAVRGGHLDRNFDPDTMNWKRAVMKGTVVPPERVEELRDWGWQTVNTEQHVAERLRQSTGARWQEK